jgi:dihydroorotate dehydrogenase subfamily 1
MDLSTKLLGKEISGPFTIPSGIVATEASTIERIANDIPEIGILTPKSTGLKPIKGNLEPILAKYSPFSFINAVGLTNPGAEETERRFSRVHIPKDKFLLFSLIGTNEKDFREAAEILYKLADGYEINISCPHSEKYGQAIGHDYELAERITRSVASLGKPVFVKASPNLDVKETTTHAVRGGAAGLTLINTRGPEEYLFDGYPVLSHKTGGVSGKEILELGLRCVREARSVTNLPIIGCGGISTAEDIGRYKEAGADFFGIGSATAGMDTEEMSLYFQELLSDMESGTNNAADFLKEVNMKYIKYRVNENRQLAEDLFILKLDDSIKVESGQFVFAWLPEKREKPFSVLDDEPLTLLVRKRGCFTDELSRLERGQTIYIRGPYGKSIQTSGNTLLVGGGTGIAALYLFAKRNKNAIALLGAKDKKHLPYLGEFVNVCKELYLTSDDGGIGYRGIVTDSLDRVVKETDPRYFINCGPEPMIMTAIQKEMEYVPMEKIYSSIEFLTMCGIGVCGKCATPKGYRSCVDGTFLKVNQI